jgi:type 1 fimbria pilin
VGGWKFQAASLNDINFSTSNNLNCSSISVKTQRDYSRTSREFIKSLNYFVSNGSCQLSLSYSITLVADPNSSPGTNTLSPLINIAVEDRKDTSGFAKSVESISLGSVTPGPSPQNTCSLSVPSNLSLGNASDQAWRSDRSKQVNATNFNIAINCSQKLTTKFTPTVAMEFKNPLTNTCLANNELTSTDATNATIEIFRNLQGFIQQICPTTFNPTPLAFNSYDPASTQLYSDSITLTAAFRGAGSGENRPKTGPFNTRVTFTVKYE